MNLPFSISFLYPAFLWLLGLIPLFLALGWPERRALDRRRRWLGLAIRLLVLLGLVLGLAGAQFERPVDVITTVFVLDASDSISAEDQQRMEGFLREALAQKPEGDQAAVILFGADALVERLPRPEAAMPALASTPIKTATDIEDALRLALALLPNEGGRRIVLFSDGRETQGQARRLLDLAAARQVEMDVYPLGKSHSTTPEVLVERVSAPAQARQGQMVAVEVVVTASQPLAVKLRLLANGALVESRAVRLVRGRNPFEFNLPVTETGFQRFRVEIEAAQDGRLQNNWGAAFTTVYGPPQVLVVEGHTGEAANLVTALAAVNLNPTLTSPAALPDSLASLAAYDAVILVNVPAGALPNVTQQTLASYVRDLGRGLVMIGGPESYGAGGYLRSPLEKALPVDMEVRNRSREPNIALVLAVDKSGSMGACHCDNPDLNQTYIRAPSGLPKIDIAKEAIFQAAAVLGDLDYLGVVSFDNSAHWQLDPGPWVGEAALEQAIGGITANGQTNIYAGLVAAEDSLAAVPARIKHIILLTDGWSHYGAYDELTARLAEEGITLSIVAAGGGSAEYLAGLARKGGGHYYPAKTMSEVPQIFLKETIRAAGNYIIEEPFLPVVTLSGSGEGTANPILRGLDLTSVPALLGYNGTTPKAAARIALLTPRGDPLLAAWQYGLGRSVAWTSDLSGRWAKNWLTWEEYARFAGQMVNWSLPKPGDEQLDLAVSVNGSQATLRAMFDKNAAPLQVKAKLLDAAGEMIETELRPSGPQRYQATVSLPAAGVYLAQVTAYAGQEAGPAENAPVASQTGGLVVPYSAEYAYLPGERQDTAASLLADLAVATGGQALVEPAQAFAHNLAVGRQTQPLWPALLLLATLLFPFDVAIRRLRVGRREWQQAQGWLLQPWLRLRPAPVPEAELARPPASPTIQAFRQVRQRVQRQPGPPPAVTPPASNNPPESKPPPSPPPTSTGEGDTLARLKAAKKRIRR